MNEAVEVEAKREQLLTHALAVAARGVQVNDGYTYIVHSRDLVDYADTIRTLIATVERQRVIHREFVAEVISRVVQANESNPILSRARDAHSRIGSDPTEWLKYQAAFPVPGDTPEHLTHAGAVLRLENWIAINDTELM